MPHTLRKIFNIKDTDILVMFLPFLNYNPNFTFCNNLVIKQQKNEAKSDNNTLGFNKYIIIITGFLLKTKYTE